MRDVFEKGLKQAMLDRDKTRLATLRLINAAIKDRDIDARGKGKDAITDDEIVAMLGKMIRQREESSRIYDDAGRPELAAQERAETEIIRSFLPRQMADDEMRAACQAVVESVGAQGLRDMGKCMGALKERFAGQMDFGKANAVVKDILK
jgi:uncharacterized protein YqeY